MESYDSINYHMPELFVPGTIHHAAEIGSVAAVKAVEQQQRQLLGLPAQVVLEQRDDLLQCVPLHVAAERGHLDVVQHILSHADVDVDAADGHQVRPLHLAAINNHAAVVKDLVDKGANVTKQDSEGDLPSHWAATKGHVEMLEMLLDRGAPVDAHNKSGWTATHRAAYNGRVGAAQLLLRRGASIHAVTNSGCSVLHLAASGNHLGVMELLLKLGASTHMRDQQGATAADMCIGDAARGLIADKEAGNNNSNSSHSSRSSSAAVPRSRPDSSSVKADTAKADAAAGDISRVPHMPRFKPAANTNLDADGFPTSDSQLAGQKAGGSELQDEGSEPQMLLVEAVGELGEALAAYNEDDGAVSVVSGCGPTTAQASYTLGGGGSSSFAGRPGQLSRMQSGMHNNPTAAALSASPSFNKKGLSSGGSARALDVAAANLTTQQTQPGLVGGGKQKQAGPMQRFLKNYSLDRKGLFAP